jgi:hypothetical protein
LFCLRWSQLYWDIFFIILLDELETAETLKTRLVDQLRSKYGAYLFFEHGARTSDSGGCGISHAHLHAVPFSLDKDPIEKLMGTFHFEVVSNLPELKRIEPHKSYLYYESVRGSKYVLHPPHIPSQYIRRLLAEALGIERWDWRQCGSEEKLLSTLTDAARLLAATADAPR